MRRYIEVPVQLLDIEGDGFHIMVKGMIHGKEANFLIDTGASRSVFDPNTITDFIDDIQFEKKEGMTAGVGSSDLESSTFVIDSFSIGDMKIHNYEAVALDLENIHEMYAKLALPHIDGIIGGDLLKKYKAVINYRSKKLRLTPTLSF
jgi:predicted aspartyl protease